jgi:hypothetical protein
MGLPCHAIGPGRSVTRERASKSVWLHSRCWPAWHDGRKAEAVAALATMGIAPLPEFPDNFGKNGVA